jgi:hypothetical protein
VLFVGALSLALVACEGTEREATVSSAPGEAAGPGGSEAAATEGPGGAGGEGAGGWDLGDDGWPKCGGAGTDGAGDSFDLPIGELEFQPSWLCSYLSPKLQGAAVGALIHFTAGASTPVLVACDSEDGGTLHPLEDYTQVEATVDLAIGEATSVGPLALRLRGADWPAGEALPYEGKVGPPAMIRIDEGEAVYALVRTVTNGHGVVYGGMARVDEDILVFREVGAELHFGVSRPEFGYGVVPGGVAALLELADQAANGDLCAFDVPRFDEPEPSGSDDASIP